MGNVSGGRGGVLEIHRHGRAGRWLVYSGEVMKLHERIELIENKADLIEFISALSRDLQENADTWENATLERYLLALTRWLEDSDGYYQNQNRPIPQTPSWRTVAEMLIAAKMYE